MGGSRHAPRFLRWLALLVVAWAVAAYLVLPALWEHHEHNPAMAAAPLVTRTAADIPGDPLNVALVGSEAEVISALDASAWHPADPITLRSSLGIVASVCSTAPIRTRR